MADQPNEDRAAQIEELRFAKKTAMGNCNFRRDTTIAAAL
jgi:hypothetical protein